MCTVTSNKSHGRELKSEGEKGEGNVATRFFSLFVGSLNLRRKVSGRSYFSSELFLNSGIKVLWRAKN